LNVIPNSIIACWWDSVPACKGVRLFRYLAFFFAICQNERAAFQPLLHKNYKPL
jgi:hypothetical protein